MLSPRRWGGGVRRVALHLIFFNFNNFATYEVARAILTETACVFDLNWTEILPNYSFHEYHTCQTSVFNIYHQQELCKSCVTK